MAIKKSTMTLSGAALPFRQGISVNSLSQTYVSLLPHVQIGEFTALAVSGSHSPVDNNFFYDNQAGIGKERLERPGYHVVINHQWDSQNYGEPQPFDLGETVFVEKNTITSGSNALLLSQNVTSTLSLVDRYQSIVSIGQLDGIIEIFPTRKIIDNTAPISYMTRPPMQVSLSTMVTQESMVPYGKLEPEGPSPYPMFPIGQFVVQNAKPIPPFSDRTNAASGSTVLQPQSDQVTDLPQFQAAQTGTPFVYQNHVTASLIEPFDDITAMQEFLGSVFSSSGRGLTANSSLSGTLYTMTGSIGHHAFNSEQYSATAGFEYALSHQGGWKMGTDSLAFGGLKK